MHESHVSKSTMKKVVGLLFKIENDLSTNLNSPVVTNTEFAGGHCRYPVTYDRIAEFLIQACAIAGGASTAISVRQARVCVLSLLPSFLLPTPGTFLASPSGSER